MLDHGATGVLRIGPDGERRQDELSVFVQSFAPPPRMLVFGAIDFAAAVARVGKFLGYRVTVCDARGVFATRKRFPEADEVVVEWPHRYLAQRQQVDARTVICVLTHDPKFDVPLLEAGAADRRRLHRRDGQPAHPRRPAGPAARGGCRARRRWPGIASPIGLDIGARTPEETAVSIAAEIVALRWGGTRPAARPAPTGADPPVTVAGLVLAAGEGRRLGRPKALLEVDGERLVDRAVRVLQRGRLRAVYVVPVPRRCGTRRSRCRARPCRRQPRLADRHGLVGAGRAGGGHARTRWSSWSSTHRASVRRRCAGWSARHATAPRWSWRPTTARRATRCCSPASTWPTSSALAVGDVGARAFLAAHPDVVTWSSAPTSPT